MNNQVFNYSVIPSVVRADMTSQIKIRPLGENASFKAGLTYTLAIRAVDTAGSHFGTVEEIKHEVMPDNDGCLTFEHYFSGEQKHVIFLTRPEEDMRSMYYEINNHRGRFGENASVQLEVYSLKQDLYGMKCYKGEVHCHTCESDGIQDALHTVGNYRNAGYDFMALTDHFTSFASEKAMRVFKNAPVSMTLMLGEEVHVPSERIHTVHMGGRESINEYFRNNRDKAYERVAEIEASLKLPETVNKNDYAWRAFIAEKAHEFGGIAILSHPFWRLGSVYFISPATAEQLMRDGVHDALDLRDDDMEAAVALWADLRADGIRIPIVGSTDSHRTSPDNPDIAARGGYTLVISPDPSKESIMASIRADRSLCVSTKSDPEFVYGSFRLVKFAKFLLDNYYPVYKKLCWGQGTLMAEYPVNGEADEKTISLLSALNERSDAFSREFFGY